MSQFIDIGLAPAPASNPQLTPVALEACPAIIDHVTLTSLAHILKPCIYEDEARLLA